MAGISSTSKDLGLAERRDYIKHLKQSKLGKHRWRVGLGLLFVVVCIVSGFLLFNNKESVIQIFENAGSIGIFGFIAAVTLAIVLLLPTPVIKIFAGAVFPLHIAVFVNFVGTMLGGLFAFFIGRWLFRDGLLEAIANNSKLQRIESAIGQESLRISVLVRLSPLIPDEWLNYILAAGPIDTKPFASSNCASIVYCFAYAYYGWAFGQLALREGGLAAFSESTSALVMMVVGLVATVVATVIVTKVTMRALGDVINDGEDA